MLKKESLLKNVTVYSCYLLLFWGFYRLLFKLPEEVEEIFIKPFFWLIPVFHLIKIEKAKISSLGITLKNLFPAVYLSLGLGVLFLFEALLSNFIKYNGFNFAADLGQKAILTSLGLSFATAFSEEISFRGYIFNRLWQVLGKKLSAGFITTVIWTLMHLPISIFVWKLGIADLLTYLFLTAVFSIGSCFVFAKTKNIFSSILLHVLWEWPIILFR